MLQWSRLFASAALSASFLFFSPNALAVDQAAQATQEDAIALVKKGAFYLNAHGKDKLLAEASDPKGAFAQRELHMSVYDLKGVILAHSANRALIGKDVSELKDNDGVYFVKEILAKASSTGSGSVNYKWVNPATKALESKSLYFERSGELILAAGSYKAPAP